MTSTAFEPCDPGDSPLRPDDLFVRSLAVQGGQASIAGETTPFARVVMTGVRLGQVTHDGHAPRHQQGAVLKLEHAARFAAELRHIMNDMVRSSRTPTVPSSGTWSWTSVPPLDEDILVSHATASGAEIALSTGATATVKVDFTGILVRGLCSSNPPLHVRGAVFSGPRQVQALISSLRKVVDSALEKQRLDTYVAGGEPLTAFGF